MQREELLREEIDMVLRGQPLPPQELPDKQPQPGAAVDNGQVVPGGEKESGVPVP